MKSLREQFEEDYTAVSLPANNRKGFKVRYVYYAPWYLWDIPEAVLKQKKLLLAGISAGSLLFFLMTGTQNSDLNRYLYVELAGTIALAFHVLELFSILQFLFVKYRTSRMTYSGINRILNCVPLIRGLCLMAAAISGLCYMLLNSFCLQSIVVTAEYLVCSLLALYISKVYRKIPLRTEKNETY